MQILGDLIRLPERAELPLPWWHRASLGLLTGTTVWVGLSKSSKRPVPDLVVSVLNPHQWERIARFEIREDERFGVLHGIFDSIAPPTAGEEKLHNVALAESATIEDGKIHHGTIITELSGPTHAAIDEIVQAMRSKGFKDIVASPLMKNPPEIAQATVGLVSGGWVRGVNWRSLLTDCCGDAVDAVDLSRAVVSADTGHRLLRFVFPKKGAFAVKIIHLDVPGALREILNVLARRELNVLSALLRRGGAPPKMAELLAVCEPATGRIKPDYEELKRVLGEIHQRYGVRLRNVSQGRPARSTLMPVQDSDVIAHPDDVLAAIIDVLRSDLPATRNRIFLSQRWDEQGESEKYSKLIQEILKRRNFHLLEARPEQRRQLSLTSSQHVAAKMWLGRGGIVLLTRQSIAGAEISLNMAHELGFLQGQGKPVLVLIDKNLPESAVSFEKLANFRGAEVTRFDPADSGKLELNIGEWIDHNLV
jgi:hypothetical protein